MALSFWIIQIVFVPAASPFVIGIIKKIKARLQNRQGASIVQPYRDIWKLFHKDEVISRDASWIFRVAPFIVFAVTLIVGASIPLVGAFSANGYTSDVLVIIYTMAIGTFFLALAGMDTGSAFGGFGSSREMTVSALAEGGFIFSLLTLALLSGTTNLFSIAATIAGLHIRLVPALIFAFAGFFIVLLAETARFPFDNPATHLELTMIHEAMLLEHSGKRLALMEWASANKLLLFIALASNLFFPWGIAQQVTLFAFAWGLFALAIKIGIFCLAIAVIESSIAKLRFFRLPDVLIVSFVLSGVAIILLK